MRRRLRLAAVAALATAAALLPAAPASAHVVPSTTIELDVHESDVTAALTLPAGDLALASGIEVTEGRIDGASAEEIETYLESHFSVSTDGDAWVVDVSDVASSETEQWGTGLFPSVTATARLTPPDEADLRSFALSYDAILHQVVTADIFVILHSDWAAGELESARDLGVIAMDTRTGAVAPLEIDLDDGGLWQGFVGMLALGMSHIAEGTDHQLFLLTLLLPAPLLVIGRRWKGVASIRRAIRRIAAVTVAFTIGHSATLALGALGLPVPQQPVEALIAVSILIAAAHAVRPLFPGREPLVAGLFGLIHGMAFSMTLSSLDLSGWRLALSLLGFNLGIEAMQLLVVVLVLPPLVALARTPGYAPLRIGAAALTALAAVGWLLDRVGVPNPLGAAADSLAPGAPWAAAALWIAAAAVVLTRAARSRRPAVAGAEEPATAGSPSFDRAGRRT